MCLLVYTVEIQAHILHFRIKLSLSLIYFINYLLYMHFVVIVTGLKTRSSQMMLATTPIICTSGKCIYTKHEFVITNKLIIQFQERAFHLNIYAVNILLLGLHEHSIKYS